MSELVQQYVPMSTEEFVALLDEIRTLVEGGDSFEGYLNYLIPDFENIQRQPPEDFMVQARYRIGNRDGQGGMRFVGELVPKEESREP